MKLQQIIFTFSLVFFPSFAHRKHEDTDEDNGGPSSEFKAMGYDWTMQDIEYNPLRLRQLQALQKRSLEQETPENPLIKDKDDATFFESLPAVLRKFENDLQTTLSKAGLQALVTGRIKSLTSLINKMKGDGITDYHEITDIVGLRVTFQTINDILAFKKSYLDSFDKIITEIRCYGICGPAVGNSDPREKKYWPWKGSGYRRLHFKVAVPELNTEAEIQLGTPYMTLWAEWAHVVVYKGPKKLKNNINVKSYSLELAQYYMMLDNIRSRMGPRCPRVLRNKRGNSIFSPRDWKTFGSPNNACNFWNDLRVDMP